MKHVDVKDNAYIDSSNKINDKDPKFKVGDHVRISKYENIFAKGYTPNWFEEVFVINDDFDNKDNLTNYQWFAKNAVLKAIKSDLENKIPNIRSLIKKTDYRQIYYYSRI